MPSVIRQFSRLFDIFYWKTAVLIAQNQLSKQYRNSFLGHMWTLLQPVTMVMVYSAIMPLIMRYPQEDYILFIIASLPLWTFIAGSITGAGSSIIGQAETLKRCLISSTIFPVSDVLRNAYLYLSSFTAMYVVGSLMLGRFDSIVLMTVFYLIPVIIILMAGAIAIAFVAPYIRDVSEIVLMGFNVMFWLTPVLYPITILPEFAQQLMLFNPIYIMIHPVQVLAYKHELPSFEMTLRLLALTVMVVAAAYAIYRKCRRNYVYYL